MAYFVRKLPGQAWAVSQERPSNEGTPFVQTLCVCDRQADAERIAYCLTVTADSEETDAQDMRDIALFLVPPRGIA